MKEFYSFYTDADVLKVLDLNQVYWVAKKGNILFIKLNYSICPLDFWYFNHQTGEEDIQKVEKIYNDIVTILQKRITSYILKDNCFIVMDYVVEIEHANFNEYNDGLKWEITFLNGNNIYILNNIYLINEYGEDFIQLTINDLEKLGGKEK